MVATLIYFGVSTVLLGLLSVLYIFEDARGGRIILPRFRKTLDKILRYVIVVAIGTCLWLWGGLVRLVLRYGVYQMLGALVTYLINLEQKIESTIFRHKGSGDRSDRPRNHLDEIAEHKEAIALSDDEKRRMRDE